MPSMKCYQCGKVKRCRMVVVEVQEVQPLRDAVSTKTFTIAKHAEYLCAPCARELGYA
jgi:hypothetical protein